MVKKVTVKTYLFKNTRSGNMWRATPVPAYTLENLTSGSRSFVPESQMADLLNGPNIVLIEEKEAIILYGKEPQGFSDWIPTELEEEDT